MSTRLLYRKDLLNGTLARSFRAYIPNLGVLCAFARDTVFQNFKYLWLVFCLIFLSQAIPPADAAGPLSVKITNPRYFFDSKGNPVYLTGSYLNEYNTLSGSWDFASYLDFLQQQKQNFTRVWAWEQSPWIYDNTGQISLSTQPYERTGPGLALDGGLKFDLTRFNQAYFDQLRSRAIEAAQRGIYVSVMLFEGFSTQKKLGRVNPWLGDPFQQANNINGINGDPNRNGGGEEFFSLGFPSLLTLQEAFARKVVDTLNDLDNVLYEVSGNGLAGSLSWQYHMIDYIKRYQKKPALQHPVGISDFYAGATADVFNSSTDWIVIPETNLNPLPATIKKVLIMEGTPPVSGGQVLSTSPISLFQLLPDSAVSSQSSGISNNAPSSNGVTLLSTSATSSTVTTTKSSSNQQSQVATPTITPNGGIYSGAIAVTLQTTTPGASVYYTTDGQSPTQSSRQYTGKFSLSDSTLVKAKAFKNNFDPSSEASAWFANAASPTVGGSGLVGYWKFDEGSGTTVSDASGNGNTGTLINGPIWTAGRVGNALFFDGIDDNVTVPDSASLHLSSSFTLSAWVNPTVAQSDFTAVLTKNTASDHVYFLYATSGPGYCANTGFALAGTNLSGAQQVICNSSGLPLNTWSYLTSTYDGSSFKLYVNGSLSQTVPFTGTIDSSTGALQIGASLFGEYFKGFIDEVRIYNRALSATEIQAIYQQDSATTVQTVATPIISPNGGSYSGSVSVTMQTATSGASIYYTTNGSTPTQSSTLFTGAITLTSNAVVKAKAFKSGSNSSAEASASFTVTQPFNFSLANSGDKSVVAGSSVTNSISATLASGSAQAVTFSASGLPTGATASFSSASCSPACSSTLTINTTSSTPGVNSTITVTATGGGVTKTTTFNLAVSLPTVATPAISPTGGSYAGPISVTMQTATSAASIYYTTNGSTPAQSSTLYTGAMTLTSGTTVKAKAFKNGYNASAEASASFTLTQTFNFSLANSGDLSVTAGSSITNSLSTTLASGSAQAVTFSASGLPTGATASFSSATCSPACSSTLTINTNASTPAGSSTITVTASGGGITKTTTFSLAVSLPTVATPAISPNGGSYTGSVSITMQTATSGASIYYTTNGSSPTQSSTLYTGSINLTSSVVVKAKAFKTGYNASAESSASFTVTTPTAWTFCATENLQCNFSGTKEVRYGTNGVYVSQIFTNGVFCDNDVFGDPVVGWGKQCEYRDVSNLSTVATPTISPAGGSYSGSVSVTMQTATAGASIYYTTDGSGPTPLSTLYTGAVNLTSSALVKTKAFKNGYISSAESSAAFTIAAVPVTAWTFCATENSPCNFSGTKEVRYGTSGVYVSNIFTNGLLCGNSVFGDPLYGYIKQCEYRDISPSFDFALSHSGNKSVIAGSSVTNSISTALVSGSSQAVSFSVSGLPSGATGFFSSPSCNPTCSTVLTVNTTGSTPAGNFPITITSTGGSVTRTTAFTLSVTLALATSTITSPSGTGNTYYVATNGSDSNSGTINQPFRTIKQGLSALRGGDTLLIRGGTYNEDVSIHESTYPNIGGTANARTWIGAYCPAGVCENVIIRGTGGATTVLIYSSNGNMKYLTFDNLHINGNGLPSDAVFKIAVEGGCPNCTGAQFIRVQNTEVYGAGCGNGVQVTAPNNEFINVKSHDNGIPSACGNGPTSHGFYVGASWNLFDGVEAYNNLQMGMQIYNYDLAPNNVTVRNSYFHNNSIRGNGAGLVVYGNNHVIYNSIFANDPRTGAAIGSSGNNHVFYNNTIFGNGGEGLQLFGGASSHIVKNNIIYGNGAQIVVYSGTSATYSNNLCGSPGTGCNLVGDPLFVDPANGNFNLQSISPAINAGTAFIASGITASTLDIGAY